MGEPASPHREAPAGTLRLLLPALALIGFYLPIFEPADNFSD